MAETVLEFLKQLRPGVVTPVEMFSPKGSADRKNAKQVVLRTLWICNNANANRDYSIYFSNDGSAASLDNAIAFEAQLEGHMSIKVILDIPMRSSAGKFYIQSHTINAISFTLMGDI